LGLFPSLRLLQLLAEELGEGFETLEGASLIRSGSGIFQQDLDPAPI
jgi:hypothetical protein